MQLLLFVLVTYFSFKEGTAKRCPSWNGFQEGSFGLFHSDATLLVVRGDDVLQAERRRKTLSECSFKLDRVPVTHLCISSFTFFHSSLDMIFSWSAGTSSSSILGIMTNCDLSESTLTLNSRPPRSYMFSLVQLWCPRRYLGISYMAEKQTSYIMINTHLKSMKKISEWRTWLSDIYTWGKWNMRSATGSFPGFTLNQSFLLNINRYAMLDWLTENQDLNWINTERHWHVIIIKKKTQGVGMVYYLLSVF